MSRAIFTVISICCILFINAQDKRTTFSLNEALIYSTEHNLGIKNALLDVKHSKNEVLDITGRGLPQVKANVSYNHFLDRPVSLIPGEFLGLPPGETAELRFGTDHNVVAELQASQLILDAKYIVGIRAGKVLLKLSREELEKTKLNLKEQVTLNYYSVLLLIEQKRLLLENTKNIEKVLGETTSLYKEGFVDDIEYKQIELMFKDMKNQVLIADRNVKDHTGQLKLLMGYPLKDTIGLSLSFEKAINELMRSSIPTDSLKLEQHVDYRITRSNAHLQKLNTWSQRASFLPNMKIIYSLQQNAQRNEFNVFDFDEKWYRSQLLGFKINVPVFSSFQKMAKVSKAKLSYFKAKNIKDLTEQRLILSEQNARSGYHSALELYYNENENLLLAQIIFEKITAKYIEGISSSFELNESRRQELLIQNKYLNAAMGLFKAKLALQKSTGTL
jgi:outer membrane protein TolC